MTTRKEMCMSAQHIARNRQPQKLGIPRLPCRLSVGRIVAGVFQSAAAYVVGDVELNPANIRQRHRPNVQRGIFRLHYLFALRRERLGDNVLGSSLMAYMGIRASDKHQPFAPCRHHVYALSCNVRVILWLNRNQLRCLMVSPLHDVTIKQAEHFHPTHCLALDALGQVLPALP